MTPDEPLLHRFFAECLKPHEGLLRAWLVRRFPEEGDLDDVLQDAYLRVLRVRAAGEIRAPKALLFAVARNVALDRARRSQTERRAGRAEFDSGEIPDDQAGVAETVAKVQELEILRRAIESLPDRCRQVVLLRRIHGLTQKEIAARMGISEHTVEAQGTIAFRKLAAYFEACDQRRMVPS